MADETPAWLGPACDLLRERIGDEAAGWLEGTIDRHDRAIDLLALDLRHWLRGFRISAPPTASEVIENSYGGPMLALIAEARGETPEATLARLRPAPEEPDHGR